MAVVCVACPACRVCRRAGSSGIVLRRCLRTGPSGRSMRSRRQKYEKSGAEANPFAFCRAETAETKYGIRIAGSWGGAIRGGGALSAEPPRRGEGSGRAGACRIRRPYSVRRRDAETRRRPSGGLRSRCLRADRLGWGFAVRLREASDLADGRAGQSCVDDCAKRRRPVAAERRLSGGGCRSRPGGRTDRVSTGSGSGRPVRIRNEGIRHAVGCPRRPFRCADYFANPLPMARKSSAFSAAPPIRPPSTSSLAKISAAFDGLHEPP